VSDRAARSSAYLERQRAILYHMLTVTREQRRCLIEGDLKGLEETNRLLGSLLDTQQALHREPHDSDDSADPSALSASLLEELHCLAHQLRQESRTNYLLACRGAAFANLSVSLLTGADGQSGFDGQSGPDRQSGSDRTDAGSPDPSSSRPHLMDQPA
jgi:hypothetical protein